MTVRRLLATQLLAALLLGGCVGVETGPTKAEKEAAAARIVADAAVAQSAAEQSGTIHIGVTGPMTGDLAAFGEQLQRGAEMAVRDINAAGGVLGRTLTLDIADDHCSAREDADNAANELVAKGVVFVDGHFCSGSTIRGSKIYAPANVLQITPSSPNTLVTDSAVQSKITTLLRVIGREDMQGNFAADWLATTYAGQPIVVISDNSLYGKGIAARLLAGLKEKGVTPILNASFAQGQTSYGNLVAKLKEIKPSVLYVAAYHDDIGRLVWAMRASRVDVAVIGPDSLDTPEFWSYSQGRGNGVRFSDAALAAERPEAAELVARLRAEGADPTNDILQAYAAVQVFAAGATATKGTDAKEIAAYLRQNTVKTILGDLNWDEKGDLTQAGYIWYVWRDGLAVRE